MNVYPANNQRLAGRTQKCVYKKKSDNGCGDSNITNTTGSYLHTCPNAP